MTETKKMTNTELERLKMYQDTLKHMMTFSSGGIVVASGVAGALFLPNLEDAGFLAISIIVLALGAALSMFGLYHVTRHIDLVIADRKNTPKFRGFLVGSIALTYIGLVFFALFAWLNLAP